MTIQNAEVKEGETTIVDFDEKAKITLHGTVQRAGQPVADVRIMLIRGDGLSMSTDLKTAVADSYGNYEIGLDEPGTYQVRVRGAGGSMGMDTSLGALKIEVPDREKVEQNLILAETGFGGRVVDEDGNGIRGVGVHAMLEGGDVMQIDSQGSSSTDESGHFQISLQKPGLYEVRVSRSGFAPLQQPLQISDGFLDDVELVLTRGASVRGVVVDELGQPIVGAMVLPASASNSGLPVGEAEVTDGSGRFAITLGGDATVDLLAWQHGYADARVSAAGSSDAAGDSGITIVLTRGAALRVRVLDADGNPRAGQTVRLIPHNRSLMQLRMDLMMPGTTDSDGMARYEGLNPGSYQVLRLGREELEPTAIEISGTGDQEVTLIDPGSQ
jgi:5-hydroxyisourate hydrolase-like protein (transthyretin family)